MAQATFSTHATVQQDGQANPFITYLDTGGKIVYQINSLGNLSYQGGVATAGIGDTLIVYSLSATLGFAVFNTAAAVNMLPTTAPTGTYRISAYAVVSTLLVSNTNWVFTFGWNDDSGAQTLALSSGTLAAGTTQVTTQLIRSVTGTAVTYTPSKTGSAASAGAVSVSILVERVI